jgi:hypothetical protein
MLQIYGLLWKKTKIWGYSASICDEQADNVVPSSHGSHEKTP